MHNQNYEGYGEKYFFLPVSSKKEAVGSKNLLQELDAKDVKSALAEAKKNKHGSGIVFMKIAEV